jgi:hypothetical protein
VSGKKGKTHAGEYRQFDNAFYFHSTMADANQADEPPKQLLSEVVVTPWF